QPSRVLYQKVERSPSEQSVIFSLSSKEIANFWWFQLFTEQQNETLYLKEIEFSNILKADAFDIKNSLYVYEDMCPNEIESLNGQHYFIFHEGECGLVVVNSEMFLNSRPIGLQLILRLSLCTVLLLLVAFLYKQSSTQRILLVSVAFFIACFPLKMEWSNWTLGVMGLVALVTFIIDRERTFRWRPIYWLPVAIYALYLAGCLYAGHKADAYRELDASISLIIFPIVFSIVCLTKDNILLLLRFFIRAAMVFCVFGLLSFAAIVPEFGLNILLDGKLYSPLLLMWPAYPHPSVAAMVLVMAVPVAMYLHRIKGISMVEMLLCLCCVMIFSMLTGARVAMIAVPMVIVLGVGVYCKIKPVFKWALAGIAVAGCVFIFNKYPELTNRFSDPIREQLRITAMDAFKQKPIFGWGTGSMKQIIASEETVHRLGYDAPQATLNHFHNQYLDSLVQFGIAGSLVFFALFVSLACIAVRRKDFLLAAFLAIYLLFMLVESPLATVKGIQPMMFWLCFFTGSQNITAERYPHKKHTVSQP
ncbi:MAG: O-antigen ligase family protein, partial [Bacteroidales bacterium]|nr:O-antigen ligase family protein [Bacteroidales bacterium]